MEPPPDKILHGRISRAWIDEQHVIHVSVTPGAEIVLADAEQHMQFGQQLAPGHPYLLLLVNIAGMRSITREARMHHARGSSRRDGPQTRAIAIVVNSPLTRAIANFFVGLNRPQTPLRLFTHERAALDWLQTFGD